MTKEKENIKKFRVRKFPTLQTVVGGFLLIAIQIGLFVVGGVKVLDTKKEEAEAGTLGSSANYDVRYDGKTTDLLSESPIVTGDVNGDNVDDLIIPGTSADHGGANTGVVYVIFGSYKSGNLPLDTTSNYNVKFTGPVGENLGGDYWEYGVLVEDVNGDGNGDLIMQDDNNVYVVFSTLMDDVGSTTGNDKALTISSNYNIKYSFDATSMLVGDINGDGLGDLVFGSLNSQLGYIILSTLIDDVGATTGNDKTLAPGDYNIKLEKVLGGNTNTPFAGESMIGDINGDSLGDLIINAPFSDNGGGNTGSVLVLFSTLIDDVGVTTGNVWDVNTSTTYNVRFDGDGTIQLAEDFVYGGEGGIDVGDVNGDGFGDLIMGADLAGTGGKVWVVFSTLIDDVGVSTGNNKTLATSTNYNIRYEAVAGGLLPLGGLVTGDLNGDGNGDLVIGDYNASNNGASSGSVYLMFSTLIDDVGVTTGNIKDLGTSTNYNIRYDGSAASEKLGELYTIKIGDINFDGNFDLAIGTYNAAHTGATSGSVYVFHSTLIDDVGATTGNNKPLSTSTNYTIRYDGPGASAFLVYNNTLFIGDADGNGGDDLIMAQVTGAYNGSQSGSVYVINSGFRINNLNSGLSAIVVENGDDPEIVKLGGTKTIRVTVNGLVISDVATTFNTDLDWSGVTGNADLTSGKSVVANLVLAPGAASTHTLYVPVPSGAIGDLIIICPNATTLAEVAITCSGATVKKESDADTSKVTISSQKYWKVIGLSGTGGLSYQDEGDIEVIITDIGSISNVVNQSPVTYYYTATKPEIKGTAEKDSTVYFEVGGNTYTTITDGAGNFTITIDDPSLIDGDNEIEYYSIDLAGNKSSIKELTLVIGVENFPPWLQELFGIVGEDALEEQDGNGEQIEELPETEGPLSELDPINGSQGEEEITRSSGVFTRVIEAIRFLINNILDGLAGGLIPLILSIILLIGTLLVTGGGDVFKRIGVLVGGLFRRKKKYWGVVYDKNESKPIPFAVVRVYVGEEMLAQTVSDMKGRYGMLLDNTGKHKLEVESEGFNQYTKEINIESSTKEVIEDVGMERIEEGVGLINRIRWYFRVEVYKVLNIFILVVMIIGFAYTAYVSATSPSLINYIMVGVYGVLFTVNYLILVNRDKSIGAVVDTGTKNGIGGANVRVYDEERQLDVLLTNKEGKIKINLKEGEYEMRANREGYQQVASESVSGQVKVDKGGYMNRDIEMKRDSESSPGGNVENEQAKQTPFETEQQPITND